MKKSAVIILLCLLPALAAKAVNDPYADSVIAYDPGTGASASYTSTPTAATGSPTTGYDGSTPYSIQYPAYKPADIVGIGTGGYLTLAFSTPITNDPLNHIGGMDFTIFGNEMFLVKSGSYYNTYVHSGLTVWASQDNITYYQLVSPQGYGADDWFPTNPSGDFSLPIDTSLSLSSVVGLTKAQTLALYNGSGGGASFSLSWAVDSQGNSVELTSATYIKIEGSSSGAGYVDAVARVAATPEPSAAVLLLIGSGLCLCRRVSRKILF